MRKSMAERNEAAMYVIIELCTFYAVFSAALTLS